MATKIDPLDLASLAWFQNRVRSAVFADALAVTSKPPEDNSDQFYQAARQVVQSGGNSNAALIIAGQLAGDYEATPEMITQAIADRKWDVYNIQRPAATVKNSYQDNDLRLKAKKQLITTANTILANAGAPATLRSVAKEVLSNPDAYTEKVMGLITITLTKDSDAAAVKKALDDAINSLAA